MNQPFQLKIRGKIFLLKLELTTIYAYSGYKTYTKEISEKYSSKRFGWIDSNYLMNQRYNLK